MDENKKTLPPQGQVVSPVNSFRSGLTDLLEGLLRWELWGSLGWQDIRQRYRRSTFGPFWITGSMGIMIAGIAVLYSAIFRQAIESYLPFVAAGFVVWALISSFITEGCLVFLSAETVIRQVPVPLSVHVLRFLWRNYLVFAHNVWIYILAIVFTPLWPGPAVLLLLPALVIIGIFGASMGMLLGLASARFRDIPPLAASATQIFFFLSPIIWKPEALAEKTYLLHYNPIYYMIEIARGPMLGHPPEWNIWLAALAITLGSSALALYCFSKYRAQVVYWL